MPIRYEIAYDMQEIVNEIALLLFPWVRLDSVSVIRSYGSKTRGTIARCHALGKAMQLGMGRKRGFYVIEFISKRFDKMSEEDKIKTIIHELMHIPKTFGGGFRHHDHVCEENVEIEYRRYVNMKQERDGFEGDEKRDRGSEVWRREEGDGRGGERRGERGETEEGEKGDEMDNGEKDKNIIRKRRWW